jgi:hypothetical protein
MDRVPDGRVELLLGEAVSHDAVVPDLEPHPGGLAAPIRRRGAGRTTPPTCAVPYAPPPTAAWSAL